jgi:enoyl-CoA hydratase/carnithine racemase
MGTCGQNNRKDEETMSDYPEILYGVKDRVATITLNRPDKLNAYTGRMSHSIKQAMAQANGDPNVRVIVLTGAGRGFCAGADMGVLSDAVAAGGGGTGSSRESDLDKHFDAAIDLNSEFADAERFGFFVKTKKPIIAAINGPIAGIGLVMALYADIRFAADDAVFTTSFAQRGLIAEHGISWLLPKLIGQANAMDLLFSARKIRADEALHMGLVNKVYARDSFMADVMAYAHYLTQHVSPRSMAIMKAQVWKANFQDFNEALDVADGEMKKSLAHSEFKEGVSHFLEKRAPRFADI